MEAARGHGIARCIGGQLILYLANAEAIYVGTSTYPCVPINQHPGVQQPYVKKTQVYLMEVFRLEDPARKYAQFLGCLVAIRHLGQASAWGCLCRISAV